MMSPQQLIYIVEDERVIAHTLALILEENGFTTKSFSDAETAILNIEMSSPDLVITDVVLLGKMSGLELTEHIAYKHPDVKVLLMSGQARTSELLSQYRQRGLSPSVKEKPIAPATLLEEVKTLLARFKAGE